MESKVDHDLLDHGKYPIRVFPKIRHLATFRLVRSIRSLSPRTITSKTFFLLDRSRQNITSLTRVNLTVERKLVSRLRTPRSVPSFPPTLWELPDLAGETRSHLLAELGSTNVSSLPSLFTFLSLSPSRSEKKLTCGWMASRKTQIISFNEWTTSPYNRSTYSIPLPLTQSC